MYKKILFFLLIILRLSSFGQGNGFGYSVGLAFSFGSEYNRIGLHASAYYTYNFVQINSSIKGYYNFQSLGPKNKTLELQLGGGLQIGYGRTDTVHNNFIGITENNTKFKNSFGLGYIRYWDKQGTSQSTGIINANIQNFNLVTENDLFGNLRKQKDRYRTGAFLVEYQYATTKIGINALLWTYDYSHCTVMVNENSKKWARFGYYSDNDVSDRSSSLGLLSIQIKQWLPYNQQAQLNLGINSEKFRNAFQNEFIHDQPFLPTALVKRKPAHIPMFTANNKQYLHLPNQQIKPTKLYFNLGLNNMPFY